MVEAADGVAFRMERVEGSRCGIGEADVACTLVDCATSLVDERACTEGGTLDEDPVATKESLSMLIGLSKPLMVGTNLAHFGEGDVGSKVAESAWGTLRSANPSKLPFKHTWEASIAMNTFSPLDCIIPIQSIKN